jgi:hypothetical protein
MQVVDFPHGAGVSLVQKFSAARATSSGVSAPRLQLVAGLQRGQTADGGVGSVGVPGRQQRGAPLWRRCDVLGRQHHFLDGYGVGVHDPSRTAASSGEGGEGVWRLRRRHDLGSAAASASRGR